MDQAGDLRVISLWLGRRPANTRDAYERDWRQFHTWAGHPALGSITLDMLHAYGDHMATTGLAVRSRNRKLSSIKSLLSFAHNIGYVQYNVGAAVKSEGVKDEFGRKDLSEQQVNVADFRIKPLGRLQVLEAIGSAALEFGHSGQAQVGVSAGGIEPDRTAVMVAGALDLIRSQQGVCETYVDR